MQDKLAQVQAFIESLPETELRKLAAKVELDRSSQKLGLPHNTILALLRPSLALIRAPRVLIPQRAFCLPFEDMLVNGKPDPKPVGRIDRSTIQPMWDLLSKELEPARLKLACDQYVEAQQDGDDHAIKTVTSDLWAVGAEGLTEFLDGLSDDKNAKKAAIKRLGGANRLTDLEEMASVLRVANILEQLKAQLPPKPILDLTDNQAVEIRRAYERACESSTPDALYILLAIMGRLMRPFPIVKVLRSLSRSGDDSMLQKTELDRIGDIVLTDLESDAKTVSALARKDDVGDREIIQQARRFGDGFRSITKDLGITREGDWGKRMFNARTKVSEAVENKILRTSEDVVSAALPMRKGGTVPKLNEWPDEDAFEAAEKRTEAIAKLRDFADQLGLEAGCRSKLSALRKQVETYGETILTHLPKAPPDKVPLAFAFLCIAVRLTELLLDSEAANNLRLRGTNALNRAGR